MGKIGGFYTFCVKMANLGKIGGLYTFCVKTANLGEIGGFYTFCVKTANLGKIDGFYRDPLFRVFYRTKIFFYGKVLGKKLTYQIHE